MRGIVNEKNSLPQRWMWAAVGTLVALVVTSIPAQAVADPSPSPTLTPVVEPSSAPLDPIDSAPADAATDGASVDGEASDDSPEGPSEIVLSDGPLIVDGDVTPGNEPETTVPSQSLGIPSDVASAAAADAFDVEEIVAPAPSEEQVQVGTPRALDAAIAARAEIDIAAADSVFVGAAVAPLRDLTGALLGDDGTAFNAAGRPDLLADAFPRARTGDDVAVTVSPQLADGAIPGAAFAAELRLNTGFEPGWIDVAFDASGVAHAFGGDYGDRLSLVVLPACALTTPDVAECLVGVELETRHEADGVLRAYVPASALSVVDIAGRMSAPKLVDLGTGALTSGLISTNGLPLASSTLGGSVIAAVSGASSASGSFTATDLAPKGTWGVTEPAGGFTYAIPVATPPVSAGGAPDVSLAYNSQATDGKTSASNNQAGVIGEGWSMPTSYIERLYKPCTDDGGTTPEMCWDSPYAGNPGAAAYVMSLQGNVEELVYVATSGLEETFTAASDPTLKVTKLLQTVVPSTNGDDDGEYFKVETQDGSVYYFGFNPSNAEGVVGTSKSVAYEPVLGNNTGEPGFGATRNAISHQAYRFYLDLAVDASSNASTYFYMQDPNQYTSGTTTYNYIRDTQLARVDYGQVFDVTTGRVSTPEATVEFDLVKRCVEGGQFKDDLAEGVDVSTACEEPTLANAASYPDVPVDLICTGASCGPLQNAPTYFSTVRLNQINTSARDAANAWVPVETTQFISAFPTTRDRSARTMWLDSVYTRGWGGPGSEDDVDTYMTKFTGVRLNNRVDWDPTPAAGGNATRAMDRMRIANVWTDLGGRVDVTYAQAGQPSSLTGSLPTQVCPQNGMDGTDWAAWNTAHSATHVNSAANNQLCFAIKKGSDTERYHNYVVTKVNQVDLVGGQPDQPTTFIYGGSPAYAKADSVLHAPGSAGENFTFSSYRGFLTVSSTMADVAQAAIPVAESPVVPAANLHSGDFDGDGKADLFTASAAGQWKYSSGGTGPWVNLNIDGGTPLADLRFGDFNGDGKTDVFSRTSVGQWRYSSGGVGGYTNLTSDSGTPLSDLRFGDFNGDGKTDIFSRTAAGQWRYSSAGVGGYINIATEGATPVSDLRFGDFNGDGKTDVFARKSAGQWVYSSGGAVSYVNLSSDSAVPLSALGFAKIDGDAKTDVVTQNADGTWKYSSGGTGTWVPMTAPADATLAGLGMVDFTGDGKADLLMQGASGARKLWSGGDSGWTTIVSPVDVPVVPSTTTTSTNQYFRGTGGTLVSLHDGASRTDTDTRIQGRLESSKTIDGAGVTVSTSKVTYTVTGLSTPSWDSTGVTAEHNPHVVQQTGTESKTYEGTWTATSTSTTTFDAATYLPLQSTSTASDNASSPSKTQCSVTDYAKSTTPYMVVPVASRSFDGTCAGGILTSRIEVGYDGATPGSTSATPTRGLVTEERSYSTESAFVTAKADYDARGRILRAWMPNEIANAPEDASWSWDAAEAVWDTNIEESVQWDYGTDAALWTTTVNRALGATAKTWTERGHGNTVKSQGATAGDWTHYKYDGLGLMTAGWSPAQWGQEGTPSLATNIPTVMYRYDVYANGPTLRSTPAVVTTAAFVGDNGTTFPTTALAGSQRRSFTFLDGFGRAIEQHSVAPDGSAGRTVSATRYNTLGQVAWSTAPFFVSDGATVITGGGLTKLVNAALITIPAATTYGYDTLGRTTSSTSVVNGAPLAVDGTQVTSTSVYNGLSSSVTAPNGAETTTTSDLLGRVVSKTTAPDAAHPGPSQTTTYAYSTLTAADKVGFQQVSVTDSEGAATVFESDLAGQRTAMVDPNAGSTFYAYDANGQSTSVTSDAGVITMGYDVLGRMVSRTTGGSSSATWKYVNPADVADAVNPEPAQDLGLLRLSTSTTHTSLGDLTTVSSVAYDALHRPVSSTVTLPSSPASAPDLLGDLSGTVYTTTAGYDAIGQPITVGLPKIEGLPAETLTTGFRTSGLAQTFTISEPDPDAAVTTPVSLTPLVTGVSYSGTGQMLSRSYGNDVTRSYTWDPVTRALTGLSASFPIVESGSPQTVFVQKDAFVRDVMGRIVQSTAEVPVADGAVGAGQVTAECFSYDGFNRLTSAWTVADASVPTCGGAAPADDLAAGWDASDTAYAATWAYSPGGRITSLVKGAGASAATSTYAYTDAAHPAAATSVSTGSDVNSFTYDDAGRTVSRTVDGVTTSLTWDVTSSLTESDGQGGRVVYAYDASGQRVVQARVADANGPGTASAYVASGQVDDPNTASTATGDLTGTRYYTFAGSTVAVRTNDGKLSLMLGDEQGSTNVVMPVTVQTDGTLASATLADASGVTRTSYTPYGQLRGADNLAVDRGWLGQVEDRIVGTGASSTGTGLTYLNARYYDPVLGRFLSPDPLMNPGDPRTLDPYRYADNNPVVFTDASGLRPACASGGARDQDACYYGTIGVELNPILPDVFKGGNNREYDRGMNGPKRPHKVAKTSGDWLFLPKLAVNFLGGALNAGISTANGAIWLGSTVTSGPPPPIPSVPVWDGDSPERGRFYYWASYTGSGGAVIFGPKLLKLRAGSTPASKAANSADDLVNLASRSRTQHILDGHRYGGEAGNTWFPQSWSDSQIMRNVSDIATDPALSWVQQTGPAGQALTRAGTPVIYTVDGVRGGVTIRVVIQPGGEGIITAFPVAP